MTRTIIDPWSRQERAGFVHAHAVGGAGRTISRAGQASVDAQFMPLHMGDMAAQIDQALDNLEATAVTG